MNSIESYLIVEPFKRQAFTTCQRLLIPCIRSCGFVVSTKLTSLTIDRIMHCESPMCELTSTVIQVTIGGISSGTLGHLATKYLVSRQYRSWAMSNASKYFLKDGVLEQVVVAKLNPIYTIGIYIAFSVGKIIFQKKINQFFSRLFAQGGKIKMLEKQIFELQTKAREEKEAAAAASEESDAAPEEETF